MPEPFVPCTVTYSPNSAKRSALTTRTLTSNRIFEGALSSSPHPLPRACVVVGGSSGVGRALVVQLCASGDSVLAIARDRRDLEALQGDCLLRHGCLIHILEVDVEA